jgi:hypothetical protein
MRRSTILWFLIAGCLGVALFLVKHEVQRREEALASLHRQILASQEAIHVLEAEWSYLNRPDRLEALVRRHLDLAPFETSRLGAIETLPMRLPVPFHPDDGLPVVEVAHGAGGSNAAAAAPFTGPATVGSLPPLPVGRPVVLTREARR